MCENRWPSGGRSPSWLWWEEKSTNSRLAAKEVAAAWVRRADQRETKAALVAAWRERGLDRARALASMQLACHRAFDGALVQLDLLVSFSRMILVRSWCDGCISVGLDHRHVHCIVGFMSRKPRQRSMTKRMRNWMPRLDSSDQLSNFQNFARTSLPSVQNDGNSVLENILVDATIATGHCQIRTLQFRVSPLLCQLR